MAMAAAIGFLGVVAVSLAYVVSPVAAVLPATPFDGATAMQATIAGAGAMRYIAIFGIPGDMLAAAACLIIGMSVANKGCQVEGLGWTIIGLASLVFLVIDTLAGAVLSSSAERGGMASFVGVKSIFDSLFIAGTFAVSMGGATLAVARLRRTPRCPAVLLWPILLVSMLGMTAATASFFGFPDGRPMGLSVTANAALLASLSFWLVRPTSSASRAMR